MPKKGFNKIALGHHRDDIVETFFLNLFFHAKLAAMPPKLQSEDGEHIVIRPLAYCAEADIVRYAEARAFPIIPCTLCGSQETLQRKVVGSMLEDWERRNPGRVETIFRALGDIRPSQLADRELFDFASLGAHTAAVDAAAWLAGREDLGEGVEAGPEVATDTRRSSDRSVATGLDILAY